MQHFLIQLATSVLLLALASGFPRFDGPPQDSNNRRGGQQGGQQGRFHPPGNPGYGFQRRLPYPAPGPPPDFLREDVSDRSRDEYFQILERDEDKSKGELKTELAKWADKNGVKEEFDKFMIEHEEKRKDYHDLVANNLAGDALTAFEKIWKITQNDKLSRGAECQQIGAVLEGLKNKVRQLVPLIDPQIMGPPASGCFQPGPEEEDQQQYQQQEQRQRGEQQQQRGGIHQSNKGNNKKDKNGRKEDVEEEDREN